MTARTIPFEPINGVVDWTAWGKQIMAQIKAATSKIEISAIIDLNQEGFAECADKAPKAYRSLDDALDRRRRQFLADLPREDIPPNLLTGM